MLSAYKVRRRPRGWEAANNLLSDLLTTLTVITQTTIPLIAPLTVSFIDPLKTPHDGRHLRGTPKFVSPRRTKPMDRVDVSLNPFAIGDTIMVKGDCEHILAVYSLPVCWSRMEI